MALILWTSACSVPYFYIINKLKRLRVPAIYEIIGLDSLLHEESDKITFIPVNQDSEYPQNGNEDMITDTVEL